ncbi:hypothetical protein GUJ93_ZPchr0012g18804 [Zizania palustris]|uniref:Uncharacterized protein n=1 Tax=Zizania palustris TaxID=103762 RepID=A0A8J5WIT3_ZIZPA|nr:hypothetical protein GUJ93_ZPchr0012g18804 [Zizania palustris]KAG8092011.1 hypothetical protein GUJ93_ZPchr0012g18804 [Zizania palustris]KAG8092012.1 hypothetical protein GUJ93_ZPchr0012g18804 [Zizania palustris]
MAASQDNTTRCLPAWMLQSCSKNEVSKTKYQNEPVLESDKQPADLDRIKPAKRKRGKQVKTDDTEGVSELGALQPCQGREKVRRKCRDAVKEELDEIAKVTNKDARKVSVRSAPKKSRKRKLENVEPEASSPGITDDEIELTVEDLVSIAEEYVNADRLKQHEVESTKPDRYKEYPCSPSVSTETDTGGSIRNARSLKGLLETSTNSTPSGCSRDKNNKQQVLQHTPSFNTTGDIAQDMLNIFFGPLLSKCTGYENETEAIESLVQTANHATEKKDLLSDAQGQGGPVTKKKSSLKDKVSLFL